MGLRLKTALTITCFFIAVIVATHLLFTYVLLGEFDRLERERTEKNMSRVFESLDGIVEELSNRVFDWSHWDETYDYVRGANPSFIEKNINYEAVAPFELIHIAIMNSRRRLIYGAEVSSETEKIGELSSETFKALTSNPAVSRYLDSPGEHPLAGILAVSSQPVFISIAPITDNQQKNEPNGFLLFTRALSPSLQAQISKRTRLPLHFTIIAKAPSFAGASTGIPMFSSVLELSPSTITAVGTIRDLNSQAVFTITMAAARAIYEQGKATRNYTVLLMALFLVFANGVLLFFLDHTVIGRLERFAKKIRAITNTQDFTLRLDEDGRDEIGHLSTLFNTMLYKIEETTSKLSAATHLAQHANRAKSAFVAHVSHELRTPIHSLTGLLRILLKREQTPAKRAYIQMARESASTLLATINDILDLSKIESGAIELQNISFSLRQVIRASARTVAPRVDEKPLVQFRIDVTPGVPDRVIGDPLRLQQILVNLLANAAKFTNEGTVTLQVSATPQSSEKLSTLTFRVADTGIGMTPGQTARIFKPFVQADETIQHRFQGTGLGLSIVKQLSEQLGGGVDVVSTLNVGTTFTVTLPIRTTDPFQGTYVAPHGYRGVIIDAASDSRKWWGERFSAHGCEIVTIDPSDTGTLNHILGNAPRSDFVFITYRAAQIPATISSASALLESSSTPLYVSVPTSEIGLHQELHTLKRITVIDDPTSPEDILFMATGSYTQERNPHREELLSLSRTTAGCRVLIADDAPTSRLILAEMLQEAGYDVEVVENGEQIVKRIQKDFDGTSDAPISVVLTDIEMPIMSGFEAAQKIRALEVSHGKGVSLPILAITAHALVEEQARIMKSGINGVVTKPIIPEELERALSTIAPTSTSGGSSKPPQPTAPPFSQLQALTHTAWRDVVSTYPLTRGAQNLTASTGLDVADIYHRSGESMRRTKLILAAFLDSYQGIVTKLKNSSEEVSPSELIIPTHSIKGLLLDVGATEAAHLAATMETALKSGDVETALDLRESLTLYTDAVAHLIERILHEFPISETR